MKRQGKKATKPSVRPVRCWFCKRRMYYAGDKRHEPEARIEVHTNGHTMPHFAQFYAHVKCWHKFTCQRDGDA